MMSPLCAVFFAGRRLRRAVTSAVFAKTIQSAGREKTRASDDPRVLLQTKAAHHDRPEEPTTHAAGVVWQRQQ